MEFNPGPVFASSKPRIHNADLQWAGAEKSSQLAYSKAIPADPTPQFHRLEIRVTCRLEVCATNDTVCAYSVRTR